MDPKCDLCEAPLRWWPGADQRLIVLDHFPQPNADGGVYLTACYQDKVLCGACFWECREIVERKQKQELNDRRAERPEPWDVWTENGIQLAYHSGKDTTWHLLPSGRPKKVDRVLPPWKRN